MNSWEAALARFGRTDKDIDILNAALIEAQDTQTRRIADVLNARRHYSAANIVLTLMMNDE